MKLIKFRTKKFIRYKTIDSTQLQAWRIVDYGKLKKTTIIISNLQTNGKGTHGRKWYTDEKNNIAFSIIINTNCNIEKIKNITVDIALLIVKIFKKLYNVQLQIKDPNDLFLNEKKVGGILVETRTCNEIVKYIVIGIGINTNKQYFSKDIENIATSIKKETRIHINNNRIIKKFCRLFEKNINKK